MSMPTVEGASIKQPRSYYDLPKLSQEFEIIILPEDRQKDGKLTDNAQEFLARTMPNTVQRILPHIPLGKPIRVLITIEGEYA